MYYHSRFDIVTIATSFQRIWASMSGNNKLFAQQQDKDWNNIQHFLICKPPYMCKPSYSSLQIESMAIKDFNLKEIYNQNTKKQQFKALQTYMHTDIQALVNEQQITKRKKSQAKSSEENSSSQSSTRETPQNFSRELKKDIGMNSSAIQDLEYWIWHQTLENSLLQTSGVFGLKFSQNTPCFINKQSLNSKRIYYQPATIRQHATAKQKTRSSEVSSTMPGTTNLESKYLKNLSIFLSFPLQHQ